ncbi:MAG: HAMP domain-containing histidine kinase [Clostridia bacterium]|nr:HAMP domain-containing histidine kinase [Clostridia bacterium]
MAKTRSYNQLIAITALKIFLEFMLSIFILYLIPLLTVSVEIQFINFEFINNLTKTVFFNIFSWIYISITFIIIVSLNMLKLLRLIKKEMNLVYTQSLWILPQKNNEKLTLKEFVETSIHIQKMQQKIQNMIEDEKTQKEELIFKISSASHDLKTPLTIIKGNSELLLNMQQEQNKQQYVTDIYNASNKLENYINLLINYSKTFYNDKIEWKEYYINDVVETILQEAFFITNKRANLEVINNIKDNIKVKINLNYIIRAILNILDNACNYSKAKDKIIELKIENTKDYLVFSIWNNGSEFPNEIINGSIKLFHSQNKSRTSKYEHYGIGLAFTKRVAEIHKGKLSFSNIKNGAKVVLSVKNQTT